MTRLEQLWPGILVLCVLSVGCLGSPYDSASDSLQQGQLADSSGGDPDAPQGLVCPADATAAAQGATPTAAGEADWLEAWAVMDSTSDSSLSVTGGQVHCDGSATVVGTYKGNVDFGDGKPVEDTGGTAAFIVRLGADGKLGWKKTIDPPKLLFADHIVGWPGGKFDVALRCGYGYWDKPDPMVLEGKSVDCGTGTLVGLFGADGSLAQVVAITGYATTMTAAKDGGVLLTVEKNSWQDYSQVKQEFVRWNAKGSTAWTIPVKQTSMFAYAVNRRHADAIVEMADGRVAIAGSYSTNIEVAGQAFALGNKKESNLFYGILQASGKPVWLKSLSASCYRAHLAVGPEGQIYLGAVCGAIASSSHNYDVHGERITVWQITAEGTPGWSIDLPPPDNYGQDFQLVPRPDGGLYMNRIDLTAVSASGANLGAAVSFSAGLLAQYPDGELLLAGGAAQATVQIGGKTATVKGDGLQVRWLARVRPKGL